MAGKDDRSVCQASRRPPSSCGGSDSPNEEVRLKKGDEVSKAYPWKGDRPTHPTQFISTQGGQIMPTCGDLAPILLDQCLSATLHPLTWSSFAIHLKGFCRPFTFPRPQETHCVFSTAQLQRRTTLGTSSNLLRGMTASCMIVTDCTLTSSSLS